MLFNSLEFLIFFPVVVGIYFIIPFKVKHVWLLISSYYFYMCWNAKYALLIAFSTVATYFAAIALERFEDKKNRMTVLVLCFTVNLAILFVFKYFDFALHNINKVLSLLRLKVVTNPFDLVLPVGISFYTFQALGYIVDVYRGDIHAEKNIIKYSLFVSFFPQLVAGPIERSGSLIFQINSMGEKRLWDYNKIVSGFTLMVWGLFQKMVIADRCAIFVNAVYDNLYAAGTVETGLAAVLFSLQIYCDFAGYSSIAIGAARVMGFSLMENFNTPYFATGIADFWRRWHISLSTWFRDYLYIPLGGSRCSKWKKYRNLMITFLCSGLWHGASWTFVLWGAIHGLYQILGDMLKPLKCRLNEKMHVKTDVFSYRFGQTVITFFLTTFAWVFFRAETWSQLKLFFNRMLTRFNPWVFTVKGLDYLQINLKDTLLLVAFLSVLFLVDILRFTKNCDLGEFLLQQNTWFRWLVLIFLIMSVIIFGEYGIDFDSTKFIYFDF